jgi:6,7-dimethyl-8-ribityllumazine synthase
MPARLDAAPFCYLRAARRITAVGRPCTAVPGASSVRQIPINRYALFFVTFKNRSFHMQHADDVTTSMPQKLAPAGATRIAFVQSLWHREIVDQCRQSFTEEIARLGHDAAQLDIYEVAGAFEIPLHAKLLAQSGRYGAVVAAGLIVNGGIYRHEFVAQAVINGLMQVQLETGVPVISSVLTPHHFHGHDEHQQFFRAHFRVKGEEAAQACASTIGALRRLAA